MIRLVLALEAGGIPLELVGRAVRTGSSRSLRAADPRRDAVADLAAVVPGTLRVDGARPGLRRLVLRGGRPAPAGLDDPMRADDADALSVISLITMVTRGKDEQVLRVGRVIGEHVRWIAEAEADLYHEVVEQPAIESGAGEAEMREAVSAASPMIRSLAEQLLLWLYRRHDEHATLEHLVEHVETVVEDAGLSSSAGRRPRRSRSSTSPDTRPSPRNGATSRRSRSRAGWPSWSTGWPGATGAGRSSGWATA